MIVVRFLRQVAILTLCSRSLYAFHMSDLSFRLAYCLITCELTTLISHLWSKLFAIAFKAVCIFLYVGRVQIANVCTDIRIVCFELFRLASTGDNRDLVLGL